METYKNEIPNWIIEDDTFLFHGSSNVSEQELDKGHTHNFSFIPNERIAEIAKTYRDMNWSGVRSGGFGVLNSFSSSDLHPTAGKYFYLGESPKRLALYATADFAGGELLRSVYYSLKDLLAYIEEPALREQHENEIDEHIHSPIRYNVNLETLKKRVDSFLPVFKEVESIRNNYKYGLLYCYKVQVEDYSKIIYRGGMGILAKEAFATDRLKAKIIFDDVKSYFGGFMSSDDLRIERTIVWMGRLEKG